METLVAVRGALINHKVKVNFGKKSNIWPQNSMINDVDIFYKPPLPHHQLSSFANPHSPKPVMSFVKGPYGKDFNSIKI